MQRQKIFDLSLKIFLFLSPVFLFKDYRVSFARGMFFFMGALVLFIISLGLEQKRFFSNQVLMLFTFLALLRVFFNPCANINSEWFNFWLSTAKFIYVFCGVLLFYTVYTHAEDIKQYFYPVLWVCIVNFILVISQLIGLDFLWLRAPGINGFFENPSQLGQYSALSIPLLAFIHPFLAIMPILTLIISKSISPIIAAVAGLSVLFFIRGCRKAIIFIIAACFIITGYLGVNYIKEKWNVRPVMWKKTLNISLQKPFLGWGYGSFQSKVLETEEKSLLGGPEYLRAHNDYLHTSQELGFPIVVIIGLFIFGLFKKFTSRIQDKITQFLAISCLIVLINMSGQTFIRYASTAGTFIVMLALLSIKLEKEGN